MRAIRNGRWLWWVAGVALAAAAVITMLVMMQSGQTRATITNTGGTFRVQAVSLTQGTRHTLYYPSRLSFLAKEAGRFIGLSLVADAGRIDHTTSVASVGV